MSRIDGFVIYSQRAFPNPPVLWLSVHTSVRERTKRFLGQNFPDLVQFLIPAADAPVDAPAAKAQYVVREITGFVPLQVYKLGHRLEEIRKATNPFNAEVVLDCLGEFSKVIKEEIDGLLEVLFYGAKERGKTGTSGGVDVSCRFRKSFLPQSGP